MDTLFYLVAKLVGLLIRADTWIVLAMGLTWLALLLGRRRLALAFGSLGFGFVLLLAVLPLGDLILEPLERRYPANPPLTRVDGIIVLGGAELGAASAHWEQVQLNEAAERYSAGLALAKQHPTAKLLLTGGGASATQQSEAALMQRFFIAHGIAPERMLLERRARNTAENARLSRALVSVEPGQVWVLVTSAYHMPRAMRSFEAAGWPAVQPYPVDHRSIPFADGIGWNLLHNLTVLNIAVKEFVGSAAYRLSRR